MLASVLMVSAFVIALFGMGLSVAARRNAVRALPRTAFGAWGSRADFTDRGWKLRNLALLCVLAGVALIIAAWVMM